MNDAGRRGNQKVSFTSLIEQLFAIVPPSKHAELQLLKNKVLASGNSADQALVGHLLSHHGSGRSPISRLLSCILLNSSQDFLSGLPDQCHDRL